VVKRKHIVDVCAPTGGLLIFCSIRKEIETQIYLIRKRIELIRSLG